MFDALLQGKVIRQPERRVAKTGRDYALTQLACSTDGSDDVLVSVLAFAGDAVDRLLGLAVGDAVCVVGRCKLTSWTGRDGVEKRGMSIVAERAMTVYEARKRRAAAADDEDGPAPAPARDRTSAPQQASRSSIAANQAAVAGGIEDMEDDLPFS